MSRIFFSFFKNAMLGVVVVLSGCATSFNVRQDNTPSPEDTLVHYDPAPVTYPSVERVISTPRRPEPETVLIEEEPAPEPEAVGAEYVVQKGDCLYWVAKKFHISLRDLLNANGFDQNTRLLVGQKIILPGVDQDQVKQLSALSSEYIVQKGDCLSTIAKRSGVSVREIKAANGLKNDRIVAGKKLTIPEKGRFANTKITPEEKAVKVEPFVVDEDGYYVLQRGDSLSKIASKAHVTVRELQDWNDIDDPLKIQAGKKILVRQAAPVEEVQPVQPIVTENIVPEPSTDPYSFMNDADFFGSVDDIPVVQIQN